jgi:ring-1,2-phenylacetyl-CoA epoxidase subunit PaaB
MSADSQWPRYQVFLQEKQGAPHQDVGSVHATDPEIALQNARDVFVRRPECINLWVVPADAILSKTAQELDIWRAALAADRASGETYEDVNQAKEIYYVFNKSRWAGTQTLVGSVEASSPNQALEVALEKYSQEPPAFAWSVFPERLVIRSQPDDIDSLFAPSLDKPFRMSTDFHTFSAMRQIRIAKENLQEGKTS